MMKLLCADRKCNVSKNSKIKERDQAIFEAVKTTAYHAVGVKYGISRQRVEQIVRKFGATTPESFHQRKVTFGNNKR